MLMWEKKLKLEIHNGNNGEEAYSGGCEMEFTSCFLDDGFGNGSSKPLFLYKQVLWVISNHVTLFLIYPVEIWIDLQKVRELCPPKFLSLVFRASTPTMYSYHFNSETAAPVGITGISWRQNNIATCSLLAFPYNRQLRQSLLITLQ